MASRFDTDTAVTATTTDGVYDVTVDRGWWIERGPNGGYVAALLVRAFESAAPPDRHLRSLTIHYLAPAVEGPARIEVYTERSGRQLSFLSSRWFQGDRLLATAQAAFAVDAAPGPHFADPSFPGYPPPDSLPVEADSPDVVPMRQRYEYRHVSGGPWAGPGEVAETAGWIRLTERRPYDAALIAAPTDAWYPAIFSRLAHRFGVPTVDLTVHLRSIGAIQALRPDDWIAGRFRTTVAAEGFLEEDGQLWSPDGVLLAHSRQLGILLAP